MEDKDSNKSTHLFSILHFGCFLLALMVVIGMVLNFQQTKFGGYKTDENFKKYPVPKVEGRKAELIDEKKTLWTDRLLQCGYQNHSFTPEERSEGTLLMNMIKWPEPLVSAVPFVKSSNPLSTRFVILNSANTFYVGDQLQVMLRMLDFDGKPKKYGGDYLQARIHSPELKAGSVGTVVDNQNGFYYVNFTLFWPGKVQVSVSLVHPSEGIQALERIREESPDRVYFKSTFQLASSMEETVCNLCLPGTAPLCNFTDPRTGEPWFCYKPKKLPCSSCISHSMGGYKQKLLTGVEAHYFESGKNIKIPILPNGQGYVIVKSSTHTDKDPGKCLPGTPLLSPSGFYYQDKWNSKTCKIEHFDTPASFTNCLRGKYIHLFGDSTIRQWFEYMTSFVPGIKKFNLGNAVKSGPHLALDLDNTIKVDYFAHGKPIRIQPISNQNLPLIANKLDDIEGGKDTVIAFTIWCHFNTYPVETYIRRLQNIRRSILRLLSRSPDTVIVIKTANVQALSREVSLFNSDWFSYQLDTVMRKMFKGINVAFVDAWEMTIAHYLLHDLHPKQIIIKNEIDMFLSYICAKR
ncbi:NXPE family member 3-like [Rhinoraja longicauda]